MKLIHLFIATFLIAIVGAGVWAVSLHSPASLPLRTNSANQQVPANTANSVPSAGSVNTKPIVSDVVSASYSMDQIAVHNNAQSCWTAINGNVYNVTSFINQHQGGVGTILMLCGRDGSFAFNNQHGGQGRPQQELSNFLIGTLKG